MLLNDFIRVSDMIVNLIAPGSCGLRVTGCELRVARYEIRVTGPSIWDLGFQPALASGSLILRLGERDGFD